MITNYRQKDRRVWSVRISDSLAFSLNLNEQITISVSHRESHRARDIVEHNIQLSVEDTERLRDFLNNDL